MLNSALVWSVSMGVSIGLEPALLVSALLMRIVLSSSGVFKVLGSFFLGALTMSSGVQYVVGGVTLLGSGVQVSWAAGWGGLRGMAFLGAKPSSSLPSPGFLITVIVSLAFLGPVGFGGAIGSGMRSDGCLLASRI